MGPEIVTRGAEKALDLTVYGPLGFLALLGIVVCIVLYLNGRKDAKANTKAIDVLHKEYKAQLATERTQCEQERKDHAEEYRKLEDRYIDSKEKSLEKIQGITESVNRFLDSYMRRYPRRDSGGPPHGRDEGASD